MAVDARGICIASYHSVFSDAIYAGISTLALSQGAELFVLLHQCSAVCQILCPYI